MYFLLDPTFTEKTENAVLLTERVKKSVTNAFWLDRYACAEGTDIPDWERRVSILYPHVIYDENGIGIDGKTPAKYKLWYFSSIARRAEEEKSKIPAFAFDWIDRIIDRENSRGVALGDFQNVAKGLIRDKNGGFALLYMESSDGVLWRRPACGEFFYKTEDGTIIPTNIVFIGEHGTGVHENAREAIEKGEPRFLMACAMAGIGVSYSEDGIHWVRPTQLRDGAKTSVFLPCDSHNQIFWSSELSRYVIFTRAYVDKLRVAVTMTSSDSLSSLRDLHGKPLSEAAAYFTDPKVVLTGEKNAQPYSAPIVHAADGAYLGILSVADLDETSKSAYKVHAEPIFSKNGEDWVRVNAGTPLIENAAHFSFARGNDYGMIYSAAPVSVGDETKIFYAALPELHYFSREQIPEAIKERVDKKIPRAAEAGSITRTTSLNVATLKKDRYAGVYSESGSVLSSPVPFYGDSVFVNARLERGGELTISLLSEDGKTLATSRPIRRGGVSVKVKLPVSLQALKERRVRILFSLKRAHVYTVSLPEIPS